jgi:hypothetical protein
MRAPLWLAAAIALALSGVGVAVLIGRDSTILVPPPEAVAESFARQIATHRWQRAGQYVADDSLLTLDQIETQGRALLQRVGEIDQVVGQDGAIEGERATAAVVLTTRRAGPIRQTFTFVRREGMWKIVDWNVSP